MFVWTFDLDCQRFPICLPKIKLIKFELKISILPLLFIVSIGIDGSREPGTDRDFSYSYSESLNAGDFERLICLSTDFDRLLKLNRFLILRTNDFLLDGTASGSN